MKWFLNLRTAAKLFLGFGLMLLFLAVVIVTAYDGITKIKQSLQTLHEKDFTIAINLLELRADLNRQRARMFELVGMAKAVDQQVVAQEIKGRAKEIDDWIDRCLKLGGEDANLTTKLQDLRTVLAEYRKTREQQISLILDGKAEEARQISLGIQDERYEKIGGIALEIGNQAIARASTAVTTSTRNADAATRTFLILGAAALILGVIMGALLNWMIARPLIAVSQVAAHIASGDLTTNVSADDRTDEVGNLKENFRKMIESLREQLKETADGVGTLGSSAAEISTSTSQLASSATETATAISETTTTMEEVRQTADLTNQKARYVAETSQRTAQISETGRKATAETIAGINHIREQMESIAESMVRLSEQTQAVGQIIATVDDLAQQSNLLAVNASIEAAKAGEHGRGFSVVAQEVKNLADQSKQATAQVRAILSDIQKATNAAVMATEQGGKAVEAGVKQSADAGEAIQELSARIGEAAQAATQIAASSQQQLAGMGQVSAAMESVKTASSQNVESAKQLEQAARNLKALGIKLQRYVERYKV